MRSAPRGCLLLGETVVEIIQVDQVAAVFMLLDSQQVHLFEMASWVRLSLAIQLDSQVSLLQSSPIDSMRLWRVSHGEQFGCPFNLAVGISDVDQLLSVDFGFTLFRLAIHFQQLHQVYFSDMQ